MLKLGDFKDCEDNAVYAEIQDSGWYDCKATKEDVDRFEFLVAYEESEGYESNAFLLLKEKATGELYEVNSSHCSCYGHAWRPEPSHKDTLLERFKNAYSMPFRAYYKEDEKIVKEFRDLIESL